MRQLQDRWFVNYKDKTDSVTDEEELPLENNVIHH